jgi:hypothetical protein
LLGAPCPHEKWANHANREMCRRPNSEDIYNRFQNKPKPNHTNQVNRKTPMNKKLTKTKHKKPNNTNKQNNNTNNTNKPNQTKHAFFSLDFRGQFFCSVFSDGHHFRVKVAVRVGDGEDLADEALVRLLRRETGNQIHPSIHNQHTLEKQQTNNFKKK